MAIHCSCRTSRQRAHQLARRLITHRQPCRASQILFPTHGHHGSRRPSPQLRLPKIAHIDLLQLGAPRHVAKPERPGATLDSVHRDAPVAMAAPGPVTPFGRRRPSPPSCAGACCGACAAESAAPSVPRLARGPTQTHMETQGAALHAVGSGSDAVSAQGAMAGGARRDTQVGRLRRVLLVRSLDCEQGVSQGHVPCCEQGRPRRRSIRRDPVSWTLRALPPIAPPLTASRVPMEQRDLQEQQDPGARAHTGRLDSAALPRVQVERRELRPPRAWAASSLPAHAASVFDVSVNTAADERASRAGSTYIQSEPFLAIATRTRPSEKLGSTMKRPFARVMRMTCCVAVLM
jgi:hypothetical protein